MVFYYPIIHICILNLDVKGRHSQGSVGDFPISNIQSGIDRHIVNCKTIHF